MLDTLPFDVQVVLLVRLKGVDLLSVALSCRSLAQTISNEAFILERIAYRYRVDAAELSSIPTWCPISNPYRSVACALRCRVKESFTSWSNSSLLYAAQLQHGNTNGGSAYITGRSLRRTEINVEARSGGSATFMVTPPDGGWLMVTDVSIQPTLYSRFDLNASSNSESEDDFSIEEELEENSDDDPAPPRPRDDMPSRKKESGLPAVILLACNSIADLGDLSEYDELNEDILRDPLDPRRPNCLIAAHFGDGSSVLSFDRKFRSHEEATDSGGSYSDSESTDTESDSQNGISSGLPAFTKCVVIHCIRRETQFVLNGTIQIDGVVWTKDGQALTPSFEAMGRTGPCIERALYNKFPLAVGVTSKQELAILCSSVDANHGEEGQDCDDDDDDDDDVADAMVVSAENIDKVVDMVCRDAENQECSCVVRYLPMPDRDGAMNRSTEEHIDDVRLNYNEYTSMRHHFQRMYRNRSWRNKIKADGGDDWYNYAKSFNPGGPEASRLLSLDSVMVGKRDRRFKYQSRNGGMGTMEVLFERHFTICFPKDDEIAIVSSARQEVYLDDDDESLENSMTTLVFFEMHNARGENTMNLTERFEGQGEIFACGNNSGLVMLVAAHAPENFVEEFFTFCEIRVICSDSCKVIAQINHADVMKAIGAKDHDLQSVASLSVDCSSGDFLLVVNFVRTAAVVSIPVKSLLASDSLDARSSGQRMITEARVLGYIPGFDTDEIYNTSSRGTFVRTPSGKLLHLVREVEGKETTGTFMHLYEGLGQSKYARPEISRLVNFQYLDPHEMLLVSDDDTSEESEHEYTQKPTLRLQRVEDDYDFFARRKWSVRRLFTFVAVGDKLHLINVNEVGPASWCETIRPRRENEQPLPYIGKWVVIDPADVEVEAKRPIYDTSKSWNEFL